jgi:hypothetical protein
MSLRDISNILRNNQINHGIVIIDNSNDNANNNSPNEKVTQAYKLYDEGKNPVEVAVQLSLSDRNTGD